MTSLTYEEFVSVVIREFPIQLHDKIELARIFHDTLESSLESFWQSLSTSELSELEDSWIRRAVDLVNDLTGVLGPYGDDIDYAQYAQWVADKERDR